MTPANHGEVGPDLGKYFEDWGVKICLQGSSLIVQWLRLHAVQAEGVGSVSDQGTKIPHAVQLGKKQTKRYFFPEMTCVSFL